MSSESGQRLPMEELKRRNAPQTMIPQNCPSKEEWQELLHRLDELERHTAAHTALLREVSNRREPCPAQAQMEALARDVARIRAELQQTGKKKERRFSLPKLCLPYIPWSRLFLGLAALSMTGAALWVVWSSWEKIWNIFSPIFQ